MGFMSEIQIQLDEKQRQLDEKQREIDRVNRSINRMVNFIRATEWGGKVESEEFLKSIGYELKTSE